MNRKLLNFIILLCIHTVCYSKATLPVHIEADSIDIKPEKHCIVYKGHIRFIQDNTLIQADEAYTYGNTQNELELVILNGVKNPASITTIQPSSKDPIHIKATTIRYVIKQHLIQLSGNAEIKQKNNLLRAPSIDYDIESKHVITTLGHNTQTEMIYFPEHRS